MPKVLHKLETIRYPRILTLTTRPREITLLCDKAFRTAHRPVLESRREFSQAASSRRNPSACRRRTGVTDARIRRSNLHLPVRRGRQTRLEPERAGSGAYRPAWE